MCNVELDLLDQLYDVVSDRVARDQRIRVADIREWHRCWLGNVYVWAGRDRSVNMSKGGFQFSVAGQIARLMATLDSDILSVHTPCHDMTDERLIEAIAVVHVELILIHPFREGNGRLARLLTTQAGHTELDYSLWDENRADYFAAIHAGLDDYEPMKRLVRRVMHASERREDV